jgi:hypothetical protein
MVTNRNGILLADIVACRRGIKNEYGIAVRKHEGN